MSPADLPPLPDPNFASPQEALEHHQRTLQTAPQDRDALYGCCLALIALHRRDEMVAYANRLFQAGFAFARDQRPQEGLDCLEKVIALGLQSTQVYLQCGLLLRGMARHQEALAYFDLACAASPDLGPAFVIRAITLAELNRHREALADYQRGRELSPDNFPAQFNPYSSHLALGEYEEGWERFEWRWRKTHDGKMAPDFARQFWTGEQSLEGKTILLYAEHGQGDVIQFCRLAERVAERGARVFLAVQPSLKRLLTGLPGVDMVVAQDERTPPYDFHCPLMSVPRALKLTLDTVPAKLPYLHADPVLVERWARRIGTRDGRLRVGLAWAGEARLGPDEIAMNQKRSIPFARLAPLLDVPAVAFYSVQKGIQAQQQLIDSPLRQRVSDFSDGFTDFAETAAMLTQIDLLITVDTAVAHLAGALGRPVWLLNRYDSCWRWLMERDDSPWYPEVMRIFRQPAWGDWDTVLAQAADALWTLSKNRGGATASAGRSRTM